MNQIGLIGTSHSYRLLDNAHASTFASFIRSVLDSSNFARDQYRESGKGDGDNTGSPSYVARVALDRTSLNIEGEERVLGPGMAVTAEIKTGSRRILSYLLSPLRHYAQDAGRER